MISRAQIQANEHPIRPHIRRTPVLEVDGADFGLDSTTIVFKLELFQHGGSFKARGAFMNLLTRDVPDVGVVAASGGNHGVAVAFAAMKLGRRARIFVPSVASPAKIDRIRRYGAELVIGGDRYADALEASQSGPNVPVRFRSMPTKQSRHCSDKERSGWNWKDSRRSSTRCSSPWAAED